MYFIKNIFKLNMGNKVKRVIIYTILIIAIILGTKVYATTGEVINDSTRIRKNNSVDSDIVEEVSAGGKVEILSEEGEWYKVKYRSKDGNIEGYIRKDLVNVEEETTEENKQEDNSEKSDDSNNSDNQKNEENGSNNTDTDTSESNDKTENEESKPQIQENSVVELDSDIDLRVIPIFFASKNARMEKGTTAKVLEIVGNWCHIESNNSDGWVIKSKIENLIKEEKTENNTEETDKQENNSDEEKTEQTKEEENKEEKEENKEEEKEQTKEEKMYVSTTVLNVRKNADSNSTVIDQLSQNDQVTVLDKVDNTWSKVKVNGKTGYVATKYLSDKKTEVSSRSSQESRTTDNNEETKKEEEATDNKSEDKKETTTKKEDTSKTEEKTETKSEKEETKSSSEVTGSDIVAYAKKFLGYKYVYGTAGPNTFDCSGFTSYVYKHFGYKLSRTSSAQRSNGKSVSKSELKAGDIICFSGHVGIYIGGNQFIHAANPSKGVIITSLSDSYYVKTYITARRILD